MARTRRGACRTNRARPRPTAKPSVVVDRTAPPALTSVRQLPYPAALRELEYFTDTSWGNDVTDSVSFVADGDALTVWVDHPEKKERTTEWGWNPEAPEGPSNVAPARFIVCRLDVDGEPTMLQAVESHRPADEPPIFQTDDPAELVAFVALHRGPQ